MDIKEIALKVADSLRNRVDGISHMQSNQGLVGFAAALLAEIQKQNELYQVAYRWQEKGRWLSWHTDWSWHDKAKELGFPIEYAYAFPPSTEPQWRTIESAPKDGTEILLYSETYGVDVAHFHKGKWRTTAGQCDIEYPTHWMPLPEAPKGEQK